MARKTSTTPTYVFTVGIQNKKNLPFKPEHQSIIDDQLFRAWRYRKVLTKIECRRRSVYRKVRASLSPEIEKLETEYEKLQAETHEARKKLYVRKKDRDPAVIREVKRLEGLEVDKYKELKKERKKVEDQFFVGPRAEFLSRKEKVILQHLKDTRPSITDEAAELLNGCPFGMDDKEYAEARRALCKKRGANDPKLEAKIALIVEDMQKSGQYAEWLKIQRAERLAKEKLHRARKASGCFTATYQAVEDAARQSFSKSIWNPKIPRFNKEGKIGLQLKDNGGLTKDEIFNNKNPNIKFVRSEIQRIRKNKSGIKVAGTFSIKLAGRTKSAVWLDVPVIIHRPMPDDAIVKWVYLVCKRVGIRRRYELQFTIESKANIKPLPNDGMIAINLGWRVLNDGDIRVATTWDGHTSETIYLPEKMRRKKEFAEKLLSYSDIAFDTTKKTLHEWLKQNPKTMSSLKDMNKKLSLDHITSWRAHAKLARVAFSFRKLIFTLKDTNTYISDVWRQWKDHRLVSKLDLFDTFEVFSAWLKEKEITESSVEQMALYLEIWRRKDEHLINWARSIQRKLVLHRREIYRRKAYEYSRKYNKVIVEDWNKREVSRKPKLENDTETVQEEKARAIRQFCGVSVFTDALAKKFGSNLKKQNCKKITIIHFNCGGEAETHPKESTHIQCGKCGQFYDQDLNAAKHLWHRERSSSDKNPGTARKGLAA